MVNPERSDDLFDLQMKLAKIDTKDDLKRHFSEPRVKSSSLSGRILGWWKVRILYFKIF